MSEVYFTLSPVLPYVLPFLTFSNCQANAKEKKSKKKRSSDCLSRFHSFFLASLEVIPRLEWFLLEVLLLFFQNSKQNGHFRLLEIFFIHAHLEREREREREKMKEIRFVIFSYVKHTIQKKNQLFLLTFFLRLFFSHLKASNKKFSSHSRSNLHFGASEFLSVCFCH